MVSLKTLQPTSNPIAKQPPTSPRTSLSSNFFDERDFISICPNPAWDPRAAPDDIIDSGRDMVIEFEFLSVGRRSMMVPADQLFHQGKLLPFRKPPGGPGPNPRGPANTISSCHDDDPSPRPPKCTVMWKELLSLKKSRAASSSLARSSDYSSSSCSRASLSDGNGKDKSKEKRMKKKVKERRTNMGRMRPAINGSISSQAKSSGFSPIFPSRKDRLER